MKKQRRTQIKERLAMTLKMTPEASKVENRYRAIRHALLPDYPTYLANKEISLAFLSEIVYLDRQLRKMTEGIDDEKKEILSQEFQIEELGAEPNYNNNVKQLKNL